MDPKATCKLIVGCIKDKDFENAVGHYCDLKVWVGKGGCINRKIKKAMWLFHTTYANCPMRLRESIDGREVLAAFKEASK